MQHHKLFFYSLSALLLGTSGIAYAEEFASVPELEGGITASIGTFYVQPSAENLNYAVDISPSGNQSGTLTTANFSPDYSFGTQAMIGYLFDETANGIELAYRNLNTSDGDSGVHDFSTNNGPELLGHSDVHVDYELNTFDLLINQYVNIGEHMQLRFNGGLSYVELEQNAHINVTYDSLPEPPNADGLMTYGAQNNAFTGWGPRMGIDTRYAFGEGLGIVGNGSVAYYLGEFTLYNPTIQYDQNNEPFYYTNDHNIDAHAVLNLRANLGLDYVYAFDYEELSTLGLELGYQIDYYNDAASTAPGQTLILPYDITFSGPYLNLKGVF
ncbi:MAG: Lpg1974 family pore-forming outer membrane protein [Gammaproteobacteria bacterium]|jgi:hypothetical protein